MGSEPWNEDRDAALRALLVERVDSRRTLEEVRRAARPEPRRLQAVVTGVVLVAVVAGSAAAVLLAQQRPSAPAGFTTPAPVASATLEAAPAPTPAEVLQTPSPVTTSEPTVSMPVVTATTPPPTAPPTSSPSSGTLVAPDGWTVLTRAELHAFVVGRFSDDPDNAAIWEEQAWLDIRCMAEKGFLYDPIGAVRTGEHGLTAEERRNYEIAMYGPQTDLPYDWRTAGCHGRSVHVTGQDHAN